MSERHRATDDEMDFRVEEIRHLLAMGYSTTAIVKVCEQRWQVTVRQVYRYLEKARELDGELARSETDVHRGQILSSSTYIMNQAVQAKHLQVALQALELKRKTVNDIERKGGTPSGHPSAEEPAFSTGLQDALRALETDGQVERPEDPA